MSFKIRKITEKDLKQVVSLADQGLEYHRKLAPNQLMPMDKIRKYEHFKQFIRNEAYLIIVAEQDNNIIGYLVSEFVDTPWFQKKFGCEIREIVIDESYQSKGIGTELINVLKVECYSRKVENIRVDVLVANSRAINFYHNFGFYDVNCKMILDL
jgi:ribosomal protein S18 acetylase RimI-like enzyme